AAKMEAERLVAQARADHDDIIAAAHRQAQAAQERARALEERRSELMDEIEAVRGTLASLEGELEEKRLGIGLSEPTELTGKMILLDEEGEEIEGWEEGHTVRVIRPSRHDDEVSDTTEVEDHETRAEDPSEIEVPETAVEPEVVFMVEDEPYVVVIPAVLDDEATGEK